jgi:hypothetical protein
VRTVEAVATREASKRRRAQRGGIDRRGERGGILQVHFGKWIKAYVSECLPHVLVTREGRVFVREEWKREEA